MAIVRIKSYKLANAFLLLVFFLSVIFLLKRSSSQGLTDTGIYLEIGNQVFKGRNPFLEGARTGALGTVVLYTFSLGIPKVFLATVFQLMNIAGIIFFASKILPIKVLTNRFLAFTTILIWTSPVRENLVCHQINGLVLGLISFALSKQVYSRKNSHVVNLLSAICLAIAIDLKPHLALGGIIIITFFFKQYKIVITSFIFYVCSYAYLYLNLKAVLHLQWLENLRKIDNINVENKWNDISNFWPILDAMFGNQAIWYMLSILGSFVTLFLIGIYSIRNNANLAFICWGLWPIFSNYSHLYDILILTVILVFYLFYRGTILISGIILIFVVIPQQILVPKNQILVLGLVIFFIFARKIFFNEKTKYLKPDILILFGIPLFYFSNKIEKGPQIQSSATVVEVFLLCLPSIWYYRNEKILNLKKEEK